MPAIEMLLGNVAEPFNPGLVGQPAAPTCLADVVGDRSLKQSDLIRMREQLQRLLAGAVLISGPRQRFNQWTIVTKHCEFSLVEEGLHLRHVRMKTV